MAISFSNFYLPVLFSFSCFALESVLHLCVLVFQFKVPGGVPRPLYLGVVSRDFLVFLSSVIGDKKRKERKDTIINCTRYLVLEETNLNLN